MGGAIAIGYALKYPEQVQMLIPVDTWGISPTIPFGYFSYWYINKTNLTISQYKWIAKSRWLAKWFIEYSLIGDKRKITGKIVDEVWRACKEDNAGKSMLDFQRSACDKNGAIPYYKNELSKLEMPVVFVHGQYDTLVPVRHLAGIKNVRPGTKVHILKKCKHWSVKEKPNTFFSIVQHYARDL
jgi:pimeloyl-ACP methyl ester carboxylesterase